jgi:hypothetical protein
MKDVVESIYKKLHSQAVRDLFTPDELFYLHKLLAAGLPANSPPEPRDAPPPVGPGEG